MKQELPTLKVESERTEVVRGEGQVLKLALGFVARARRRLDFSASYIEGGDGAGTAELIEAFREARRRGVSARLLTDVNYSNLNTIRSASSYLEVRHIAGLKGNSWSVNDGEYLSALSVEGFASAPLVIYSNASSLVSEHQSIFDALWSRGEPLRERAKSLDAGVDLPEVDIIRDAARIKEVYLSLVERAQEQVFLILPTAMAFRRDSEIGIMDSLEASARRGVRVRLLTPVDAWVLTRLPKSSPETEEGGFSFRAIPSANTSDTITMLIIDRTASITIDERAPSELEFEKSVGSAMLSTREPRVRQSIRFFDRVWSESELREAESTARKNEEISRKRAELMQDILTHDIRNFNQVARLNAELLADEVRDRESAKRVAAIIRAVDGSSRLIERTKRLGSIMAAEDSRLRSMNLAKALERSRALVSKSNPAAKLKVKSKLSGSVLADELLDEVFVNILSNAVKYTEGDKVEVAVTQEASEFRRSLHGRPVACWKVSISDRGRGIPDYQKPTIFKRYLETAKGSGLGLSIVHALVTDRYGGKVGASDRVPGDPSKGTTIEVWLPKAPR